MNRAELPYSFACERNKQPIWEVLEEVLPQTGSVLEIGSGTGQHVVYFASRRRQLRWQPSDRRIYLRGLNQRLQTEGGSNIQPAIVLDVLETWPQKVFDAVYSANTAHIMSWPEVCAMFAGVAPRLAAGGAFCLYGPFNENGKFTSPSNAAFDVQLRRENPHMGLRDLEALESLAGSHNLSFRQKFQLPANNQLLLFRKNEDDEQKT